MLPPPLSTFTVPKFKSPVYLERLAKALSQTKTKNAVVVSAGLMEKTVKVRVGHQKWNSFIGKNFNKSSTLLVHDPNSSLRTGDIISISPGWPVAQHVKHVVKEILAPFGVPIDQRPPVPTVEERVALLHKKKWDRIVNNHPAKLRRWEGYKRWSNMRRGEERARERDAVKVDGREEVRGEVKS